MAPIFFCFFLSFYDLDFRVFRRVKVNYVIIFSLRSETQQIDYELRGLFFLFSPISLFGGEEILQERDSPQAVVVATLEHLLHGDERQRLKQSWLVHDLKPEERASWIIRVHAPLMDFMVMKSPRNRVIQP